MLTHIAMTLIARAERRLGVTLDYTRKIAATDIRLLLRYNKIFGFLDPNTKVPPLAYHTARLRGALAADCGTCVEAEINLARGAGLTSDQIDAVLAARYDDLPADIAAVAVLADAVTAHRVDASEARTRIIETYGHEGLIELSYAMNGAALLPGIKRAMGYATACDLTLLRATTKA
ncbi:MAG: hypothetical protein AAGL89_03210 [Pseudomonadota bacterium]